MKNLVESQQAAARANKTTIDLHPNSALAWVHEILPSGRVLTTEIR